MPDGAVGGQSGRGGTLDENSPGRGRGILQSGALPLPDESALLFSERGVHESPGPFGKAALLRRTDQPALCPYGNRAAVCYHQGAGRRAVAGRTGRRSPGGGELSFPAAHYRGGRGGVAPAPAGEKGHAERGDAG